MTQHFRQFNSFVGFSNPTYGCYYLIGRLKRVDWIPQYNLHLFRRPLLLSSQEEPVIRQLAAQEFGVELHQNFVKLQNLVLHFAAFGYRQPRAVQAHD